MQPVIVLGDKTSHGGTVITCSSSTDTHGKGWARVGDKVACPRCKGIFPIAEGDATLIDDGLAVAYHGCRVACGATLIAGQMSTYASQGADTAENSASGPHSGVLAQGGGDIGAGMAGTYEEEAVDEGTERFRGRFRVVDAATGEPIAGQAARVRSSSGAEVSLSTDADGYTDWIERDAREALAFDLNDKGTA